MTNFRPADFRTRIVPDFNPNASEVRRAFCEFFSTPYNTGVQHFKLNYWYVKDLYNYIRAYPQDIIGSKNFNDFYTILSNYAQEQFGMLVTPPYLSIYINGMYQSIHSDQMNGTYAYVWSITENLRTFVGGETMVARPNTFDQLEPRQHRGRDNYLESFPPMFNQLLLFDSRLAHCVNHVHGTMDPCEGRVVLHGHIV